MRKDGKSQYQLKKDKLLKIKEILIDAEEMDKANKFNKTMKPEHYLNLLWNTYEKIWEIVKDEKNND